MGAPNLYLIVMAGGSGTRFWPKSTSKRPKQLLGFGSNPKTLLQQTLERFEGTVPANQRMIVTTQSLEKPIAEQAAKVQILAEPQGRNTAPCIYWAARVVAEKDPRAVMIVVPSDHFMAKPENFIRTVKDAAEWAAQHDDLVTLGVKPTRPETGYGYLKTGTALVGGSSRVDAFVEKPNLAKAEEFLRAGNYLWNGGMFLWRAEVILNAYNELMPEMKKAWEAGAGKIERVYPSMTATSIDYGVMEKAKNVVTFALDCGWDDLGSWTSLESLADLLRARVDGNVVSAGEVIPVDALGNIVDAPGKAVALLGVKDLIVVETAHALLIAGKDRAQDMRLIVEQVKKKRPELA